MDARDRRRSNSRDDLKVASIASMASFHRFATARMLLARCLEIGNLRLSGPNNRT